MLNMYKNWTVTSRDAYKGLFIALRNQDGLVT